ncbi:MAG: IPT/TIG domain-containing protein [Planctomycetota bacterium]
MQQSKPGAWLKLTRALLLAALGWPLLNVALAGFSTGKYMGGDLSDAEAAAINSAITEIDNLAAAETSAKNKGTLERISKCLKEMMKKTPKRRICKEKNPRNTWKAALLQDGKCSWEGDKMNIDPDCISTSEPAFSQLIAVLVHEGIHALQWPGDTYTRDSVVGEEWVAYSWEKYILEKRKNKPGLTASQKKGICKRLETVCKKRKENCDAFATEKARKAANATSSGTRKSLSTVGVLYDQTAPSSGTVEVIDTATYDTIGKLDTGRAFATDMRVFLDAKGADALYVGFTSADANVGGIVAFYDVTGDGLPDQEGLKPVADGLGLPLAVDSDPDSGSLFVLDVGPDDVNRALVINDTNLDGLPDSLQPTPFADAGVMPELKGAWELVAESSKSLLFTPLGHGNSTSTGDLVMQRVFDSDGDGVGDQLAEFTHTDDLAPLQPVLMRALQDGDKEALVEVALGSLAEVWVTDALGAPVELVGAEVITSPDWIQGIPLTRSLLEGELVVVSDATNGLASDVPDKVAPQGPQIFDISRSDAMPGDAITLTGRNFTLGGPPTVVCSDVPATLVAIAPNALVFQAPQVDQEPAGFVAVEVSTDAGTSGFVGLLIHGDCNGNGQADVLDIAFDQSLDLNENEIPDECEPVCQPDLGFQGPGTSTLSACGDGLGSGQSSTLLLEGAPAGTSAILVYGFAANPMAFAGGTLVPVPAAGMLALVTDGAGQVVLPLNGGGGPFSIFAQYAVVDTDQALGYQLSNALELQFQP